MALIFVVVTLPQIQWLITMHSVFCAIFLEEREAYNNAFRILHNLLEKFILIKLWLQMAFQLFTL